MPDGVIGVLLTGNLDDGTAGLGVIQDEGGITVVQDPKDALYPGMPLAAVESLKPDHIVPLAEIAPLLVTLASTEVTGKAPLEETETQKMDLVTTCPGCGGVLNQYKDDRVIWYQCRVGHRFASETMMSEQNRVVEEHIWRMLSLLKEKEDVLRTLASDARTALESSVDPEHFEKQAQATAEAQERINDIIDELGPVLFPEVQQKEASKIKNR